MVDAVGCILGAQCLANEPSRTSGTLTRVFRYILEIRIENPRATLYNKPCTVNTFPFPLKQAGNGWVRGGHALHKDVLIASAEKAEGAYSPLAFAGECVKWCTRALKHQYKLSSLK